MSEHTGHNEQSKPVDTDATISAQLNGDDTTTATSSSSSSTSSIVSPSATKKSVTFSDDTKSSSTTKLPSNIPSDALKQLGMNGLNNEDIMKMLMGMYICMFMCCMLLILTQHIITNQHIQV